MLQSLPNELIARIFENLLDDPESCKSFLWTCKRFCQIGNNLITSVPEVRESRLFAFNLALPLNYYMPHLCQMHGLCSEQDWRTKTRCEVQYEALKSDKKIHGCNDVKLNSIDVLDSMRPIMSSVSSQTSSSSISEYGHDDMHHGDNPVNCCYYHRLFCMVQAKYITFNSIKFRSTRLLDRGCIKAFRDSSKLLQRTSPMFIRPKLEAVVELELYNCDISLDWLNTILNEIDNIAYLALIEVSFADPIILVEPKDMASKTLKRLKISGDRTCRINDAIFTYFLDHFPANTLDLTGTRVEFHKRIIQRFYPYGFTIDMYPVHPTELLLTFPMVLLYLKKYSSIVQCLVADQTDITLTAVKKLLQDEELEDLVISAKQCQMFSHQERLRLAEQVSQSDMLRVTF